jgi:hypothetical protein
LNSSAHFGQQIILPETSAGEFLQQLRYRNQPHLQILRATVSGNPKGDFPGIAKPTRSDGALRPEPLNETRARRCCCPAACHGHRGAVETISAGFGQAGASDAIMLKYQRSGKDLLSHESRDPPRL